MDNDILNDHNRLNFIIMIAFFYKIIQILIYISTLSYFIAMSWLIMCHTINSNSNDNFLVYF